VYADVARVIGGIEMENLFAGRSVYQHMNEQLREVMTLAAAVTMEALEQGGPAAVVDALMARCVLEVPRLEDDRMAPPTLEERGSDGAEVRFSIPFTGNRTLFFVRPSNVTIRLDADVQRTALAFSYASPTRDAPGVHAEVGRVVSEIRGALEKLEAELRPLAPMLRAEVEQAVDLRQRTLAAAYARAGGKGAT
jgi:hypothetical protein